MVAKVVVSLCWLLVGCNASLSAPNEDDLGVLFIGNSLTASNDLPDLVQRLLEDAQVGGVHVEAVAFPNFGLEDHWFEGSAREAIALGGWDVVVLQQGPSATEGRPSLLDYAARFGEEIEAVGATPALYMVWPSATRDFDFDRVSNSYQTAAEVARGLLFPAGEAWRAAWRLDPGVRLYSGDGFHPSVAATYLNALVMVEQLAAVNTGSLPLDAGGTDLSSDLVELLQQAAAEANAEFARPVAVNWLRGR
jgi:hypothetical protein